MIKQFILILSLMFIATNCATFSIYQYPKNDLGISFETPIQFSIANFGFIPYGTRSIAPLMVASPIEACETLNLPIQNEDEKQLEAPFLLIKRGGCSFTQKAMVAQAAGAKMAVIMDNKPDQISNIILTDDGFGDNVEIPTVFISVEDGEKIVELYNSQNPQPNQVYDFFQAAVSFDVQQTNKVDVKFFINPPNRNNFKLINNFFKELEPLVKLEKSGDLIFTPVYQIFKGNTNSQIDNKADCIRQGRYCTYDQDGVQKGTGRDLVEEYLYQICLEKVAGIGTWYKYVEYQHENCYNIPEQHECVVDIYDVTINDQKIRQCMYPSNQDSTYDAPLDILENQIYVSRATNIHYYPSVSINNVLYRGSLQGDEVLEAVCATYSKPVSFCRDVLKKTQFDFDETPNSTSYLNQGPNFFVIFLVVCIILILFALFMMFIYRRIVVKDLQREMNQEVNQIVSQYMAFNEKNNKNGGKLDISQHDEF